MTSIESLLAQLASPARRALQNAGITSLEALASYDERTFKNLHGIGPNAHATCKRFLESNGMHFSNPPQQRE